MDRQPTLALRHRELLDTHPHFGDVFTASVLVGVQQFTQQSRGHNVALVIPTSDSGGLLNDGVWEEVR